MNEPLKETPIRAAVFTTVDSAEHAIRSLLDAGFSREQITVVCSDEGKLEHFRAFEHQGPAGTYTTASAAAGGALGAFIGGSAALIGTVATGGVALAAAGGLALWSGAVVGGLVGAMMSRGVEHELANLYQQAVIDGKILVAAQSEDNPALLSAAEQIFSAEQKLTLPLREG
jgi:hypothetical protein